MKKKGRVTIPTDANFVEGTKIIAEKWGADAVRDCDGTVLPANAAELADKVYNTYFVIRGDNEWGDKHPEEWQHAVLMSDRVTAESDTVSIDIAEGYYAAQLQPDPQSQRFWVVTDRTTGDRVREWTFDEKTNRVTFRAAPFHEYTVSYMATSLWDPVQMYNYITNDWDCEKQRMYDPCYPLTAEYIKRHLKEWCAAHPETNVVRFTTFLYQFSLIFNKYGKEKYVDWFGYTMSASPKMFDDFAAEYGYTLDCEDIADNGMYNTPFKVPSKKYLDYMDFIERRVTATVKELVAITHDAGKEAMMFLGDCWIGAEPYGDYFPELNLDAVVGSVGGGVTVRMLADIPGVKYREGRFLPYFFPDTFYKGNDPTKELNRNWLTTRRALMRKCLDRIGFGGYLSLAAEFPDFIDRAAEICDEFRAIYDCVSGGRPYASLTVAIVNSWGKKRSWMSFMVAHELWYQQIYSYQGILEALSGLPVNVRFLSFDDVLAGIDPDIDVMIVAGDAGTAFSGGERWKDERLVVAVKKWVHEGHGFIGVGEPTAVTDIGGRTFALADVLGVDVERGFTLSEDKYNIEPKAHFITADIRGAIDFGEGKKNMYALPGTDVLDIAISDRFSRKVNVGEVNLAANTFGRGRGVYMAGLPYSFANARLLYRAMLWAAGKEALLDKAFSSNPDTECNYYPDRKMYAVLNNTARTVETDFSDIVGKKSSLTLAPHEIRWIRG